MATGILATSISIILLLGGFSPALAQRPPGPKLNYQAPTVLSRNAIKDAYAELAGVTPPKPGFSGPTGVDRYPFLEGFVTAEEIEKLVRVFGQDMELEALEFVAEEGESIGASPELLEAVDKRLRGIEAEGGRRKAVKLTKEEEKKLRGAKVLWLQEVRNVFSEAARRQEYNSKALLTEISIALGKAMNYGTIPELIIDNSKREAKRSRYKREKALGTVLAYARAKAFIKAINAAIAAGRLPRGVASRIDLSKAVDHAESIFAQKFDRPDGKKFLREWYQLAAKMTVETQKRIQGDGWAETLERVMTTEKGRDLTGLGLDELGRNHDRPPKLEDYLKGYSEFKVAMGANQTVGYDRFSVSKSKLDGKDVIEVLYSYHAEDMMGIEGSSSSVYTKVDGRDTVWFSAEKPHSFVGAKSEFSAKGSGIEQTRTAEVVRDGDNFKLTIENTYPWIFRSLREHPEVRKMKAEGKKVKEPQKLEGYRDEKVVKASEYDLTLEEELGVRLMVGKGVVFGDVQRGRHFNFDDMTVGERTIEVLANIDFSFDEKDEKKEKAIPIVGLQISEKVIKHNVLPRSSSRVYTQSGAQIRSRGSDMLGFTHIVLVASSEEKKIKGTLKQAEATLGAGVEVRDRISHDPLRVTGLRLHIYEKEEGKGSLEIFTDGPFQFVGRHKRVINDAELVAADLYTGWILLKEKPEEAKKYRVRVTGQSEVQHYLAQTERYPTDSAELKRTVERKVFGKNTVRAKAEALLEYVELSFHPQGKTGGTTGEASVEEVFASRLADAFDKAKLLTTLFRIAGIPAREIRGLRYVSRGVPIFIEHAWVEIALGGEWIPVDPMNLHQIAADELNTVDRRGSLVRFYIDGTHLRLTEVYEGKVVQNLKPVSFDEKMNHIREHLKNLQIKIANIQTVRRSDKERGK